jgi:hypothetical protein
VNRVRIVGSKKHAMLRLANMRLNEPDPEVPATRTNFRKLLAKNPNYFGNFPEAGKEPVEKIIGDITFEAITCIGFNLPWDLLEATIAIKLPTGYGGALCTAGTREYVRFFIDYGDGSGFQDLGLASFSSHDIPNADDCRKVPEKPLYYTVTRSFSPNQKYCVFPNLPVVRGILSWNVEPPSNPNWTPVWGNTVDQHIQIAPRFLFLGDLLELIPKDALSKLPSWLPDVGPTPIPLPDPPPVDIATLAQKYGSSVPAHRFGLSALTQVLNNGVGQQELLSLRNSWSKLKLDFDSAIDQFENLNGNTQWEELVCLGLEYNFSRLVATFKIKLPSGFSGGLCQLGSSEYITFWTDWDDTCQWKILGTVATQVHDIADIPKDGLTYSAVIPVNLYTIQRLCGSPKISRVRAVLSWNTPSSTVNADALPYFGNILDTHVQIPPGVTGSIPQIVVVGNVALGDIDTAVSGTTLPGANFFGGGIIDSTRMSSFGGQINIQGPAPANASSYYYRIWVNNLDGPGQPTFLTNTFLIQSETSASPTVVKPDPNTGWTQYTSYQDNFGSVLQQWSPSGNDLWEFYLEVATLSSPGNYVSSGPPTPWYRIQLDNSAPSCSLAPISIPSCGDVYVGDTLTGTFTVVPENHLDSWILGVIPSGSNPVNPIDPSGGTSPVSGPPNEWSLQTNGMVPCGYTVQLQAWELSIINSGDSAQGYGSSATQGFCLRAPKGSSEWDQCEVLDACDAE